MATTSRSASSTTAYKPRQAAAMLPAVPRRTARLRRRDVEVIQYLDRERITTVVGDRYRVKDIENKWGFVPIVIIPNESFGEGPWGDSDIDQVIPLQAEFVYRESLKTAILEQTIMQPLAIEGGDNLPEEIPMGPRDAIPVQIGGRVYRVPPVQVPYQYLQSQNDLIKLIDRVGSIPDVMRSQFEGNVLDRQGRVVASWGRRRWPSTSRATRYIPPSPSSTRWPCRCGTRCGRARRTPSTPWASANTMMRGELQDR